MKRFFIALFGASAVLGAMSTTAQAAPGGNRVAAHACQQDGYKSAVGTSGGFTNAGDCTSYAAAGGGFVTPGAGEFLVPAGRTASLSDPTTSTSSMPGSSVRRRRGRPALPASMGT